MKQETINKLHPGRFKGMSGKMAAIVGYIVEKAYTDPALDDMAVTSDGYVLGQQKGDCGMNEFLGGEDDLNRNWANLLDSAGLTEAERGEAQAAFERRITRF